MGGEYRVLETETGEYRVLETETESRENEKEMSKKKNKENRNA